MGIRGRRKPLPLLPPQNNRSLRLLPLIPFSLLFLPSSSSSPEGKFGKEEQRKEEEKGRERGTWVDPLLSLLLPPIAMIHYLFLVLPSFSPSPPLHTRSQGE